MSLGKNEQFFTSVCQIIFAFITDQTIRQKEKKTLPSNNARCFLECFLCANLELQSNNSTKVFLFCIEERRGAYQSHLVKRHKTCLLTWHSINHYTILQLNTNYIGIMTQPSNKVFFTLPVSNVPFAYSFIVK